MLDSPFRRPQQRQDELRRRLESCRDQADHRAVALLEMQWVHRYGFDSLPCPSAALAPEPASLACHGTIASELATLEPLPPDPLPIGQSRHSSPFRSDHEPGDPASTLRETDQGDIELPPPPAPSLKHLRRWLASDRMDLPQAS